MTCCGRFTTRAATTTSVAPPPRRPAPAAPVLFELAGDGPLTLYGHATGARYHFAARGSRVRVDGRDARVLALARGLVPVH
jgi:hypothetical protein